jgi:preprotein translocase subunit SecG
MTGSEAFMARLAAVLAAIMLTLTAIILVDAVRKWYGILVSEPQAAVRPAPVQATEP